MFHPQKDSQNRGLRLGADGAMKAKAPTKKNVVSKERNRIVFPPKRRKVWLPAGVGSSAGLGACAGDTYRKAP